MSSFISGVGWLGLVTGVVYYILNDSREAPSDITYVQTTTQILLGSAIFIAAGYVLKFLSRKSGIGSGRCKECRKRIDKREMYCFDHRRQMIWEAQERNRTDGTGKYRTDDLKLR
jgi:hypothetical protein